MPNFGFQFNIAGIYTEEKKKQPKNTVLVARTLSNQKVKYGITATGSNYVVK